MFLFFFYFIFFLSLNPRLTPIPLFFAIMTGHFRGKAGNPSQKFGGKEAQNWAFTQKTRQSTMRRLRRPIGGLCNHTCARMDMWVRGEKFKIPSLVLFPTTRFWPISHPAYKNLCHNPGFLHVRGVNESQ